jgi:hypothetical protein
MHRGKHLKRRKGKYENIERRQCDDYERSDFVKQWKNEI